MEANNYVHHVILWTLSALQKSCETIGKIQVDETLTEDQKKDMTNAHQLFLVSLAYLIQPYLIEAKELYPNHAPLFDWLKARFDHALENKFIVPCSCPGCQTN